MTKKIKTRRLTKELLETADDMRRVGLLTSGAHEKITMRHLGAARARKLAPISGAQIRTMRARAKVSQAVFAHYLNVSVAYVSHLERGARQPTGAALTLLDVIKRKGLEAIL
jgi:putative transcriptional regulator